MNKTLILWIVSFLITAASAWFQRVTGPSYPLRGSASLGGNTITYRLDRSHGGETDATVSIPVPDTSVAGWLAWRRNGTEDPWTESRLEREGALLSGRLPLQPPAGKLQYRVRLRRGAESLRIPEGPPAVIRFKGDVPAPVLAVHIILMFTGMLFSTRTGLSVVSRDEEKIGGLLAATIALLGAGGLLLGPVVQKYAFDAYWTGWPFGTDLTDNKTVAALAAWVAVALVHNHVRRPSRWALAAAVVTLTVFMIPHSLLGSEFDYRKEEAPQRSAPVSVSLFAPVNADERAPHGRRHG